MTTNNAVPSQTKTQQQGPHKKQVRRRLHTTRPYQERFLNMAEARREIVTCLKFHRASMKQQQQQAADQQRLQQQQTPKPQQEVNINNSRTTNPTIYPSNNLQNPYFNYSPVPQLHTQDNNNNFNFNFNFLPLPNQPLGLNLNLNLTLQDFKHLDTTIYHNNNYFNYNNNINPSIYSPLSSSSSTVYSPPPEIRSIGEQHQIQMEWNDKMNLVTSAWWFKYLKTMEIETEEELKSSIDDNDEKSYHHPFDEFMEEEEEAYWLNANDTTYFPQHLSDCSSLDPALPCMEIGELDGMDSDWLLNKD